MMRKPASASGSVRGEHEVERQRGRAARLEQQQPPQVVALGLEVAHLVEHRRAGDSARGDDDPAGLALGVGVDAVETRPNTPTLAIGAGTADGCPTTAAKSAQASRSAGVSSRGT